jgi:hypothetical protein
LSAGKTIEQQSILHLRHRSEALQLQVAALPFGSPFA